MVGAAKSHFIKARDLTIIWSDDTRYWKWETTSNGSKAEVAKLLLVWWFYIQGRLSTDDLEEGIGYAAYLVYGLDANARNLEKVKARVRFANDIIDEKGMGEEGFTVYLGKQKKSQNEKGIFPQKRSDGWMELKIGEFFYEGSNDVDFVDMRVIEIDHPVPKSGISVVGIHVRPLS